MGHIPPQGTLNPDSDGGPHLKVVLATLLFFMATLCVVLRWGVEPYPALIMPDFPGPGAAPNTHVELETLEITVQSGAESPHVSTVDAFFQPFPESAHFALIAHFRPRHPQLAPDGRESLLPGWRVRQARLAQPPYSPEVRAWLRSRVKELFPGIDPWLVEFRWYRTKIDPSGRATGERRLTGTVEVPLSEKSSSGGL